MNMKVYKEIPEDIRRQVYQIAADYARDMFTKNFPEDILADMRLQWGAVLLDEDGRVASCIVFTGIDGSAHISMMATRRDLAGIGYGKRLMEGFVEYVSSIGYSSIELYTFSPETNPKYISTIGFYKNAGFTVVREYPDLWEPGTVTLKMRREWAAGK